MFTFYRLPPEGLTIKYVLSTGRSLVAPVTDAFLEHVITVDSTLAHVCARDWDNSRQQSGKPKHAQYENFTAFFI